MEDLFSDIDREKRDSIYPTDNYNSYYFGSDENLEEALWPYNMGECYIDPCEIPEDEDHFEDGPYMGYDQDEEF